MPGVGNSSRGCPCGFGHARTDPKLITKDVVFLETPPEKNKQATTAALRACRSCRQLYALTLDEDDELPNA